VGLADDPGYSSRAADAAPAFFMGPRQHGLHSAAHKKAAQCSARLGSLVAPLELFAIYFSNFVYYISLLFNYLGGVQNAATCRKVATMVAAGVATFQIPPNLGS